MCQGSCDCRLQYNKRWRQLKSEGLRQRVTLCCRAAERRTPLRRPLWPLWRPLRPRHLSRLPVQPVAEAGRGLERRCRSDVRFDGAAEGDGFSADGRQGRQPDQQLVSHVAAAAAGLASVATHAAVLRRAVTGGTAARAGDRHRQRGRPGQLVYGGSGWFTTQDAKDLQPPVQLLTRRKGDEILRNKVCFSEAARRP